jgi:hypothetical protein
MEAFCGDPLDQTHTHSATFHLEKHQESSSSHPKVTPLQQFPSKKISKKAEDYIESILTRLETSKDLLNEQVLNNTYSYTRQVEERDGGRRNQMRRAALAGNNEESAGQGRRRYKKIT